MEPNTPIPEEINLDLLSREEQKVIIAKDVIANVIGEIYVANQNQYIANLQWLPIDDLEYSWDLKYKYKEADVKGNWSQIKQCEVCALGACIMSITKYKNHLTFEELPKGKADWHEKQRAHITSVFTPEELAIIELMFEGNSYEQNDYYKENSGNRRYNYHNVGRDNLGAVISDEQIEKAKTFYAQYSTENERLIGIMQHIIHNKGHIIL